MTRWVGDVMVPDGYRVVQTDEIVASAHAEVYLWKWIADRRAKQKNDEIDTPMCRYEAVKITADIAERLAPVLGVRERVLRTIGWAVVAKQNVLRKPDEGDSHATHP